jgi:methionine-gamma-lyase
MTENPRDIETKCIHAGEHPDPCTRAVVPPIYQTTIFDFDSSEDIEQYMLGKEPGYMYSRYGNPTLTVLENKMAALEGAEEGLSLASGNAATTVAILLCVGSGDHIVSTRDVYGGTYGIMTDIVANMGVDVTFVDSTDLTEVVKAFRPNTKLAFIESPTNPTIRVSDIRAIAEIAHSRNARLVVDNTFATPYNQNPIALGADLVTASMTKYLNGHSDVTGGIIVGRKDDIGRCREIMKQTGASLNPIDGWLVIRGLKTFAVRMERHNSNAMQVARWLEGHPGVERVVYPGLPSHPQHEVAAKQMNGFGGMVSFVVKGGYDGARKVIDGVRLAMRAVSLGSIETLITQPSATSHRCVPKEQRELAGITDGLLRLSVGIEKVDDIIADLNRALGNEGMADG